MRNTWLATLLIVCLAEPLGAAIQQAWLQRYNAGRTKGTNEAVAMALDSQGNLVVAGSSRSTLGDFDYVTLKYSPTGSNLWVRRYTSPGGSDDQIRALVIDAQDNVLVTGTSATIKYDSSGAPQWSAPYGGRALACDTNEDVVVTGYLDNDLATVRLHGSVGTNLWERTHDMIGHTDVSQQVILDADGNAYVAGFETWAYEPRTQFSYYRFRTISYTSSGSVRFSTNFPSEFNWRQPDVRALHVRGDILILTGNLGLGGSGRVFTVATVSRNGGGVGSFAYWVNNVDVGETASALNGLSDLYLTGGLLANLFGNTRCRTLKVSADQLACTGECTPAWKADYVGPTAGYNRANAIGLDAVGNVYVAGQSTGAGTEADWQDWVTINYSADGQQQWVQRYNGPAHRNDVATCMAVTPSGEIYVAGWSQASSNLTELIVIKYAELANLQVGADRSASLQFFGTPGQRYRIDTSTNLPNWEPLGEFLADPAGIYRYVDTNAPNHPWRFYRTGPP